MNEDCLYLNDVECPFAPSYEECDTCGKFELDTRPHPLDDSGQADYDRDMEIEMGVEE